MNFECRKIFLIFFFCYFLKANLDLSKSKKFSELSAVASSHSISKRAAGDNIPKLPDMPKIPMKMPELPKIEIPQIKMRRKRQDNNPTGFDSMNIFNGFKQMANATQTELSKLAPPGSLFSS